MDLGDTVTRLQAKLARNIKTIENVHISVRSVTLLYACNGVERWV